MLRLLLVRSLLCIVVFTILWAELLWGSNLFQMSACLLGTDKHVTVEGNKSKTIFVISLQGTPSSHESNSKRLQLFQEEWHAKCGDTFAIEHCPGVNDPRRGYGVTMSFVLCINKAISADQDISLFFEDDARLFNSDFCGLNMYNKYFECIPNDTFVALLGGHGWRFGESRYPLYRETVFSVGAYGFAVPRNHLATLRNEFGNDLVYGYKGSVSSLSPDESWYLHAKKNKMKIYAMDPLVVWHEKGYSNTWKKDRRTILGTWKV